jgi:hypothetical protein
MADLDDIEDLVAEAPAASRSTAAAAQDLPASTTGLVADDDEDLDLPSEPAAPSAVSSLPLPPPVPPMSARVPTPQLAGAPHDVELVFVGVAGYQQASALELAVNDLLPDGDVDIVEFEHGQLVLSAQAADLNDLADQVVAATPAALQLGAVCGDRATFRCV